MTYQATALILTLFFLSGFSALVYETSWVRLFGLSIGSTAQATACVLAVFLGGLSVGALVGGLAADRAKSKTLLMYGLAELGVGLSATGASAAFYGSPSFLHCLISCTPQDIHWKPLGYLLVSAILLVIPTALMGATLPLLTSYLSTKAANETFFSKLYCFNTLGAVGGSLFTSFVAFPLFGISGTIKIAVLINIGVGLAAVLLACTRHALLPRTAIAASSERLEQASPMQADTPVMICQNKSQIKGSTSTPQATRLDEPPSGAFTNLMLISCLCGFTALSWEVLWTRLLRAYMSSSTYAFTFMIANFLFGLALGSLLYMRRLRSTRKDWRTEVNLLGGIQISIATICAINLIILPLAVKGVLATRLDWLPRGFAPFAYDALSSMLFMLPLATLTGICFPLLGEVALAFRGSVGKTAGLIYSANTLGCILGSAVTGLLLIPSVGSQTACQFIIGISILIGYLAIKRPKAGWKARTKWLLPITTFAIFMAVMPKGYVEHSFARLTGGKLVTYHEDAIGRVMIIQYKDSRRLIVNNESYSSDRLNVKRYMRTIASLPVLLNSDPSNQLVICYGVGTTAASVSEHLEVKHVDICELSPAVIACAPAFNYCNSDVLHNKKVNIHIDDGRNFLLLSNKIYDGISLEPPPPMDASVVCLYSQEFYKVAREHLSSHGLLCQWIPLHLISKPLWKMMVKSACNEFPFVSIWIPNNSEALMLCAKNRPTYDCDLIRQRNAQPGVWNNLNEVGLQEPEHLLSTLVLSGIKMADFTNNAVAITDDRPRLEFYFGVPDEHYFASEIAAIDHDPTGSGCGITITGCDWQKLQLNRKAVKLLYDVDCHAFTNAVKSRNAAAEAEKLLPENQFVRWVTNHAHYH